MNTIDINDTKTLFDNLLFFAMHMPEAKNKAAFKYVSSDWFGLPGWFFWPKTRDGVFLLKLDEASINELVQSRDSHYTLYYYPSIAEPVFDNFSCSEQLLRVSELFSRKGVEFSTECPHCECSAETFKDLESGKGIPTPDARQSISQDLFVVGEIIMYWQNNNLQIVEAKAPDRDRSLAKEAVDVLTETGVLRILEPNTLDRDVPCWDLTSNFAEDLVSFLPVEIINYSPSISEGNPRVVSYGVKQTLCRTTGIIVE